MSLTKRDAFKTLISAGMDPYDAMVVAHSGTINQVERIRPTADWKQPRWDGIEYILLLGVDIYDGRGVVGRVCLLEVGAFHTWLDAHRVGCGLLTKTGHEVALTCREQGKYAEEYDTTLSLDGHRKIVGFSVEAYSIEGTTFTTHTELRDTSRI